MAEITKPTECNRCDYVTEELEWYAGDYPQGEWLCDLCASTYGGKQVHHDTQKIVRSMCYIGNAIIAAIKEHKP